MKRINRISEQKRNKLVNGFLNLLIIKDMKQNRFIGRIAIIIFLFAGLGAFSQPFIPGTSYFGRNNYIEYNAGNLPLIISVPHGGALTPSEIPDRTCGDETVTDSYTIELGREISAAIHEITGCYPHVIISNLKRTKLDPNREIEIAACGDAEAEIAWNEYHQYIDDASQIVTQVSEKGLFIDLHGHGHAIQRLELGYLLSSTQLRYSDYTLNTAAYINSSSIRNLINTNVTNISYSELLRGMGSLGTMFAMKYYPSVPSIDDPFPLVGETYFSGGYNTERHGSKTEGTIDGIQIECNHDVRFVETLRKEFAAKAAHVFLDYLKIHYFPQLADTYCNNVGIEKFNSSQSKLYPNPFSNILNIQNLTPSDLRIYNSQGSLVLSKKIGAVEKIDLSHLKQGIYLVTITSNDKILHTEKIIKEI